MRFKPSVPAFRVLAPSSTGHAQSTLAFSLAKAGSTLLYDVLRHLSPQADLQFFSVEDYLFMKNISPTQRPGHIGDVFKEIGYCYGGFRQFPAFPVPILHSVKVVLLVRDPRDMITSLYFSLLKSHRVPKGTEPGGARDQMLAARRTLEISDIDSFARETVRDYIRMFEGYVSQGFHWRPNVAVYRYEDVIFRKSEWIRDMCDWYGWSVPEDILEETTNAVDLTVEGERPDQHVRQIKPGNHKVHLHSNTVAFVDHALGEYMKIFGYL